MAREPVKLNSPVSSAGQIGNRASYMRPGNDRSGSKALADALGSLSGSLKGVNQQVDRYQNAQRQSELQAAQKSQNEEIQRQTLRGIKDGEAGVSSRGSSVQDSPLFHQAYQEGRMGADYARTVANMERETNWDAFGDDVEDGHNKLQAFLLDQGEAMMSGYPPEMQAKMMAEYRTYANKKMSTQATEAKQRRLEHMGEDLVSTLEGQISVAGTPEELQATLSEAATLFAKAGVDNPSGVVGNALIVATSLTQSPETITAVLEDKEFAKTLSSDTRVALIDARDKAVAKKERLDAAVDAKEYKNFRKQYGSMLLDTVVQGRENPARGMEMADQVRDYAMSYAAQNPELAPQLIALADKAEDMFLAKPAEALKGAALAPHKVKLQREMAGVETQAEAMELVYAYEAATGDTTNYATNLVLSWGNEDVKIDSHDAFMAGKDLMLSQGKSLIAAMGTEGTKIYDSNDLEFGGNLLGSTAVVVKNRIRTKVIESGLPENEWIQANGGHEGIQDLYKATFTAAFVEQWNMTGAGEAVADVKTNSAWWTQAQRNPHLWPALEQTSGGQQWLAMKNDPAAEGVDPKAFAD